MTTTLTPESESTEQTTQPRLSALLDAVDVYFRLLHTGDVRLLDDVFHPAASLFDADEGALFVEPLASWRAVVDARTAPADVGQPRDEHILLIDWLSDLSAVVKVRLRVLDQIFVDHLSFVLDDDRFRIVAKTWHLEREDPRPAS
ncbi:MAG TPA: nuclear transport factor 2 family protein [Agromyces sp.]|nr:nuclear transport factor 2 family protein [Agromyces sp.]